MVIGYKHMSVIGYRHTGIVVDDMELQLAFYRDILDLEIYYDQYENGDWLSKILLTDKDQIARIVKLGKQNTTIVELIHFHEWICRDFTAKIYNEVGITHIAFQVIGLDDMYWKMIEDGVSFIKAPQKNPEKTAKVCFCYDYEGNMVELVEVLSL
jgi:catechol 2,3-dioxygenase-like lactoylglutathione lyase family enzyme